MANEVQNLFYQALSMTVTNLHSRADGDLWKSGVISNSPTAIRQYLGVKIFYNIELTGAAQNDTLKFYLLEGDEGAGGEIWTGDADENEGFIAAASAATIAEITNNAELLKTVTLSAATPGATQKGVITIKDVSPDFQIALLLGGAGTAASGSTLTYRFFEPQGQ